MPAKNTHPHPKHHPIPNAQTPNPHPKAHTHHTSHTPESSQFERDRASEIEWKLKRSIVLSLSNKQSLLWECATYYWLELKIFWEIYHKYLYQTTQNNISSSIAAEHSSLSFLNQNLIKIGSLFICLSHALFLKIGEKAGSVNPHSYSD